MGHSQSFKLYRVMYRNFSNLIPILCQLLLRLLLILLRIRRLLNHRKLQRILRILNNLRAIHPSQTHFILFLKLIYLILQHLYLSVLFLLIRRFLMNLYRNLANTIMITMMVMMVIM